MYLCVPVYKGFIRTTMGAKEKKHIKKINTNRMEFCTKAKKQT